MQQASAFLPPQTVPRVQTHAPRNLWILSSWRDFLLYFGTPLLLIPMFLLAQSRWSAQDIYLFVGAFGATGHHLPGMIRAYGDRALFERFKWRFIFAPIFLAGVCVLFYFYDLKGIVLVLFFWGVWHGMMQTYGFCRIYDAKTRAFDAINRRLDFAVCGLWFAAAVVLSNERMGETLKGWYSCGGPFIPAWFLHGAQQVVLTAAIIATVLFIFNFIRMWQSNARPNPVKVALLVTSISFWWYCNNGVTNILAGIALFEVFHDVQYLSIVWIYNRNRVEKDRTIGGFMRFVFRRSGSLMGLYVGLVFAYGSFAYFNSQLQIDNIKRILTGVVAASGLLHFYYDGFIWKVRESATRASLGLANDGTADISHQGILQGWFLHGIKWAAGFVLPVSMLCLWQIHGAGSDLDRAARVVGGVPTSVTHRFDYGVALENAGQRTEAMQQFQMVLAQKPSHADAHFHVAQLLGDDAKFDPALEQIDKAIALDSNNGEFHFRRGEILRRIGRTDEAIAEYEQSARLDAKVAQPHFAYADLLMNQGKVNEAIAEYRAGLRIKPGEITAHFRLGKALAATEQFDQAGAEFEAAVHLDPTLAAGHNNLGSIYVKQGRIDDAIAQFSEAARLQPNDDTFTENLRMAQALKERNGASPR